MSSRGGPQQGLRAEQLNSPYKRAPHSGTFGGVPGDKENAGAEARAAAVAEGKLAVEVSHHLKGALSPGVRGTQWQHYHHPSTPSKANNVPSTPPSVPFTATAAETAAAAAAGRAFAGADGHVLPLSPSATAARSMNALSHSTFDRGTGFSLSAARRVSVRTVRAKSGGGGGDGFTHAHAPSVVLRVPPGRPSGARKLMAGGRREAHERGDLLLDVAEVSPSPKCGSKGSESKASFSSCESETPKRGRSPPVAAAGLTLPSPMGCDETVSWEFEAKARRRSSSVRNAKTAAELFDSSTSTCCVTPAGGDGVGDSVGSVDGRWRKLQARGGGGSAGPPRLKLSVESAVAAAGEDDEVLLSPCCHGQVDLPAFCPSPVLVSSGARNGRGGGGRPLRGGAEENVLTSSVDSTWSMGSIDESAAREPNNTRHNDRASGSDPVARTLLCQSDDYDVAGIGFGVSSPHGPGGGGSSSSYASDSPGLSRMTSAPSFAQHHRHHHRRLHQPSPTAGTTVTFNTATPKKKGDSPFASERDASGYGTVAAEGGRGAKDAALVPSPRRDGGGGLPPALARTVTASPRAFSVASAAGGCSSARDLREAGARGCDFGARIGGGGGGGGRGRLLKPVAFRLHCPGDLVE